MKRTNPGAGSIADLFSVEAHKSHEGLRAKDDRVNMPEEGKARDDAHEIDEDYGGKAHITGPFCPFGIQVCEEAHGSYFFEEIEELVEESGFSKAVDFADLFARGEVFSDSCLVP